MPTQVNSFYKVMSIKCQNNNNGFVLALGISLWLQPCSQDFSFNHMNVTATGNNRVNFITDTDVTAQLIFRRLNFPDQEGQKNVLNT